MVGLEPEPERVPERGDGVARQVSLDHGLAIEVEDVGDVVAPVQFHPERDPVLPPSGVDPDPLSDDGLVKVVPLDVVAVQVAQEQLG